MLESQIELNFLYLIYWVGGGGVVGKVIIECGWVYYSNTFPALWKWSGV